MSERWTVSVCSGWYEAWTQDVLAVCETQSRADEVAKVIDDTLRAAKMHNDTPRNERPHDASYHARFLVLWVGGQRVQARIVDGSGYSHVERVLEAEATVAAEVCDLDAWRAKRGGA